MPVPQHQSCSQPLSACGSSSLSFATVFNKTSSLQFFSFLLVHGCSTNHHSHLFNLAQIPASTSIPWSCSYRTHFDAYQGLANSYTCSFFFFFFFLLKKITISEGTLQWNYIPRTQGNRQYKRSHCLCK